FVQDLLLPLAGLLLPIPSVALIPLFILWFGLGSMPIVVLIAFSALLPTMLSTWTGMRGVNPVLVKAAHAMNVRGLTLFWKVVLPGSVPAVLSGLRLGLAQAWRAAVAGEMIAGISHGLGIMIFSAQQFVQTDVMLATLLVIGPMGLVLEKVLFQTVERRTIEKWGMTRRV
ncbi:MAG: ABC transporter permease, partial [Chloroflexota bacterium]